MCFVGGSPTIVFTACLKPRSYTIAFVHTCLKPRSQTISLSMLVWFAILNNCIYLRCWSQVIVVPCLSEAKASTYWCVLWFESLSQNTYLSMSFEAKVSTYWLFLYLFWIAISTDRLFLHSFNTPFQNTVLSLLLCVCCFKLVVFIDLSLVSAFLMDSNGSVSFFLLCDPASKDSMNTICSVRVQWIGSLYQGISDWA